MSTTARPGDAPVSAEPHAAADLLPLVYDALLRRAVDTRGRRRARHRAAHGGSALGVRPGVAARGAGRPRCLKRFARDRSLLVFKPEGESASPRAWRLVS